METVTLSDETVNNLREAAALRGMDTDSYAEELLAISLAARQGHAAASKKRHRAMEFSGIAPSGRSVEEIDADIEVGRAEWDDRRNDSI